MTAYGDVSTAVNAIKSGATDFVLKPWQNEKLIATVTAGLTLRDSRDEVARLRTRERELVDAATGAPQPVIGNAPAMRDVFELVRRAAPTDANVLILGESGVGKELVARLLHAQSKRAERSVHVRRPRRGEPDAVRERALRPSQRRVHGRARGSRGPLPGRVARHAVPRRDRQPAAAPARQAA